MGTIEFERITLFFAVIPAANLKNYFNAGAGIGRLEIWNPMCAGVPTENTSLSDRLLICEGTLQILCENAERD